MTSIEEDPSALSRRAAITVGIRSCEEMALLAGVTLHLMSQVFQKPGPPLHTAGYSPEFPNRLTDQTHPTPNGGHIHNLGVWHTEPFFHQHKEFFEQAINNCNLLLIEGNPHAYPEYTIPSARRFFELCCNHAIAQQKTIYFIDEQNLPLMHYQGSYALPLTMIATLGMQMDSLSAIRKFNRDRQEKKSASLPLFTTRRNILRGLAALGIGSAWTLRLPDIDSQKPEEYSGYIVRGRSAIMMRNTLTVAEAAPRAKILAITGDAHAQLFEHYFTDPALLQRDLNNYRIHEAIYQSPMQKMNPGDNEPNPVVPG